MSDEVEHQERSLSGLRYRPSVRELEKDPEKMGRFVDAWRTMASKPASDESSFQYIAGIHGIPQQHCEHRSHFFPWHRAYLLRLELALNKVDPAVALPWFDFESDEAQQDGLPVSFRSVAEGGIDVLASQPISYPPRNGTHTVRAIDSGMLPDSAKVQDAHGERNYTSFWRNYYFEIHNYLHGWIGGDASSEQFTAFDPSFWILHCANDRHWWLWQLDHPGSNPPFPNRVLSGLDQKVEDVLDINVLGYEYATTEIDISAGV